jgi:hypothetical protein
MPTDPERVPAPAWSPGGSHPQLIPRPGKRDVEFLPSWSWEGDYLGAQHEQVLEAVADIEGMMYPQDAFKLYELAWFSPGPVLEIGTYRGRSAAICALALDAAGNPNAVISVDIDGDGLRAAAEALRRLDVGPRVTLIEGTATALLRRLPGLRPGLVFVDGDHTLRGVSADLAALRPVVPVGSIVVLHDYEGYEAADPHWVQVAEAADRSWLATEAEFIGLFGLSGVFVRRAGGPPPCDPASPPATLLHLRPPAARVARASSSILRRARSSVAFRAHRLRAKARH